MLPSISILNKIIEGNTDVSLLLMLFTLSKVGQTYNSADIFKIQIHNC